MRKAEVILSALLAAYLKSSDAFVLNQRRDRGLKSLSLDNTSQSSFPSSKIMMNSDRRDMILQGFMLSISTVLFRANAVGAVDLKPKEFIDVGTQAPSPDGESPFVDLANGVRVKDFRSGNGNDIVQADSVVQIQCSGKLLNLNGVSFYNTKNNNPDGFGAVPLTIHLGQGEALPGLESGIIGMRKGGIRRIIVPADLAYSKYPDLEPKPMNANDQRALDSVIKNPRRDATILFDVSVERFK